MKYWLESIERVDVKPRPLGLDLRYSEWLDPPKFIKKFLKSLIWEDFVQYPDTNLLKESLAIHHNVKPSEIFLGPGSSECIKAVFDCFTTSESTAFSHPAFPMYEIYAKQNSLHVNRIWPGTNLKYIPEHFSKCNLSVITRPESPLGGCFTKDEIIKILEMRPEHWVLVDEAYFEFSENQEELFDLISEYKNLIIARSFSKTFGAAGIRVGYLISNKENISIISKFRQMYEVSGPSLKYALFLLKNYPKIRKYCNKTIKERNKLAKLFRKHTLKIIPSQGNWIHVEQTDYIISILRNNNIHVKENIILPYHNNKWIRISIGPGLSKVFKKIL